MKISITQDCGKSFGVDTDGRGGYSCSNIKDHEKQLGDLGHGDCVLCDPDTGEACERHLKEWDQIVKRIAIE